MLTGHRLGQVLGERFATPPARVSAEQGSGVADDGKVLPVVLLLLLLLNG